MIFEDLPENCQFSIKATPCFEASYLPLPLILGNWEIFAQSKDCVVPGRVRDHKCFEDFVILENLPDNYQFSIKATPCFDTSDLQGYAFNIGKLEIN